MSKKRVQQPETESEETISDDEEEFDLVAAMNAMTKHQRTKVYALKGLQKQFRDVQNAKNKEIALLEQAFLAKTDALMTERRKIVCGEVEPSDAAIAKGVDTNASKVEEIESDDEKEKTEKKRKGVTVTSPDEVEQKNELDAAAAKPDGGIPGFWLTAMKNNEMIESEIQPRDEKALKYLTDVTTSFIDGDALKGFTITFHFAENPFFSNKTLTKTFTMDQEEDEPDTIDKMIGCDIEWKSAEQKLTVIMKQKKQRHKGGGGVRIVNREEPCPSFFHFFGTVDEPASDADDDEIEEYSERAQTDSTLGAAFRSQLCTRAVHYYNAKAIEEIAEQMGAMDFDGDDDDFDDDDEEEEEEEEPKPRKRGAGGKKAAPKPDGKECKQQ